MAKAKIADDGKTQHQRFVEAAREYGATENPDAFRRAVRALATARAEKKAAAKPKKAAKKHKR